LSFLAKSFMAEVDPIAMIEAPSVKVVEAGSVVAHQVSTRLRVLDAGYRFGGEL